MAVPAMFQLDLPPVLMAIGAMELMNTLELFISNLVLLVTRL